MAKRILLGVLQDYFGRYIDGINEENLRLAVWAGEIDLEGLELKKEVLDTLRLPLHIHCGHIQKFKVSVPWSKLGSQPVQVHIDGVYLLARLAPEDEDDGEESEDIVGNLGPNNAAGNAGGDDDELEDFEDQDLDEGEDYFEANSEPESSGIDPSITSTKLTTSGSTNLSSPSSKKHARRKKKLPRRIVEKRIRLRWANLLAAGEGSKQGEHRGAENPADQSFWSRLGAKIMDNIQITVTNVHVRLEDMMSIPGHPYAVGLTFEKFATITCDEEGKPVFVERKNKNNGMSNDSTFYKSVQMQSLAMYWDNDKPMIYNKTRSELDFAYLLAKGIWRKEMRATYHEKDPHVDPVLEYRNLHHFLLRPCSPSMVVAKNESSDFTQPRYKMDIDFDDISIVVSRRQYSMALTLQRSLAQNSILSVYREHRPLDSPVEDPAAWWKYAYKCVKIRSAALRLNRQSTGVSDDHDKERDQAKLLRLAQADNGRTNWLEIVHQAKQRELYIRLYKKLVYAEISLSGKGKNTDPTPELDDIRSHLQELEDDLEVQNTLAYRATALAEVSAEQKKGNAAAQQSGASRSKGWLSGWFAEQNARQDEDIVALQASTELTPEERAELIDAVNFFETIQDHHIPDGTVHVLAKSTLRYGSVALADLDYNKILFSSEISGRHTLESRFGNSWKHSFVLKTLTLWDHEAASSGSEAQAQVLAPKYDDSDGKTKGNACVLHAEYQPATYDLDTNEPLSKELYTVRVAAVPFRVVLLPRWTNQFSHFFNARGGYYTMLESAEPLRRNVDLDNDSSIPTRGRRHSSTYAVPPGGGAAHSRGHNSLAQDDDGAPTFDQAFNAEVNWVAEYVERANEATRKLEEEAMQSVTGARLRPDFDVEMNVAAPILLLPVFGLRYGSHRESTQSLIMLDLGHVRVSKHDTPDSAVERNLLRKRGSTDSFGGGYSRESVGTEDSTRDDDFLDAMEQQLEQEDDLDEALGMLGHDVKEEKRQLKESLEDDDDDSNSQIEGLVATPPPRTGSVNTVNTDFSQELGKGAWNISIQRIRSSILVLPNGMDWTTALTEAGSGSILSSASQDEVFQLIEEFDINIAMFHMLSLKRSPRVEVQLGVVTTYITPTGLLSLWKLRNQWTTEAWWWLQNSEGIPSETESTATPSAPEGLPKDGRRLSSGLGGGYFIPKTDHRSSLGSSSSGNKKALYGSPHHRQDSDLKNETSRLNAPGGQLAGSSFGIFYSFSSSKIIVNLCADAHPGRSQLRFLACELRGLEIQYVQRSRGSYAHVELRSIDAVDVFAKPNAKEGEEVYFVQSEGEGASGTKSLISIDTRWRNGDSPDASPRLIYTVAKFHKLRIQWNPNTVAALRFLVVKRFKNGLMGQAKLDHRKNIAATAAAAAAQKSLQDAKESRSDQQKDVTGTNEATSSDPTRFVVVIYLSSLTIALRKRGEVLAEASMTRASVKMSRSSEVVRAQGELGNVLVQGRGHELFSVASKNEALVKFSLMSKPRLDESEMSIQINSSRYVHQHRIFLEIVDYTNEGVFETIFGESRSIVDNAGDVLRSAIRNNQPASKQKSSKHTFEVDMKTFEIMFPVTPAPQEARFLAMSCANLQAFTKKAESFHGKATQVRMTGFRVYTHEAPLLDNPVDFALDVVLSKEEGMQVNGKISDMTMNLAVNQYWLIQNMLSNNIMQDPNIPPAMNEDQQFGASVTASSSEDEESYPMLDLPSPVETEQPELVAYPYDDPDNKGLVFHINIVFGRVSLLLTQELPSNGGSPESIAEFSMENFSGLVFRNEPTGYTTIEVRVASMDCIDQRPISQANWFRHLIMSNPRGSLEPMDQRPHPTALGSTPVNPDLAFFFRYIHSERKVRLDLVNFRSVFMKDLLGDVVRFWTSTDPNKENDELINMYKKPNVPVASPRDTEYERSTCHEDDLVVDWQGEFNLVDPCLCFVPDFTDPSSRMIVVRSNISFGWKASGDSDRCQFSHWHGCLNNVEAYVATASNPDDHVRDEGSLSSSSSSSSSSSESITSSVQGSSGDLRRYSFGHEGILQQLLEPTDLNWSYEYEEVAPRSKVHSRRVHLMCGQLEIYMSMNDLALIGAIASNLRHYGEHASEETDLVERTKEASKARLVRLVEGLRAQDSSKTLCSEDDIDDAPSSSRSFTEISYKIDEDYIEFVVPKETIDIGVLLFQDRGFLRVENMYNSGIDGGPSICHEFGVEVGDYLLEMNSTFVCNESPEIMQERLISAKPPFTLKFLRGTSQKPAILQDSLNVGTQKVIFNLIDDLDSGDMPLSNLVLTKIDMFLNGSSDGNYLCGSQMEMTGAHFFDLRAGSWGVLLDPGFINITCTYYSSGELEVSIDIPEPISCNLSDTFLRVISNSIARAGEAAKAEGRSLRPTVSPGALNRKLKKVYAKSPQGRAVDQDLNKAFLLRNESGLPLRFWNLGDDPGTTAVYVSSDTDEVTLGFSHHSGTGHGTIRGFCQYKSLCIAFLYPKDLARDGSIAAASTGSSELEQVWETLEGVVINKIGDGVARLVARKSRRSFSPNGLRIKWSVQIDDETRKLKLVVSSLLQVCNHLDYSVRVLANCPTWSAARTLPWKLEPGESRMLPALFGDATEIRVQPMLPEHLEENASHAYEWSGPIHATLASQGNTAYTELECSLSNGKTRYLCASVEPDEDGVTTVFALYPQVRFRNLLPQDIMFQEYIPEVDPEMPIGAGFINSGEEVQLHSLTSSSFTSGILSKIALKLEASDWTTEFPLRANRTRRRGASMYRRHGAKRFRKISFLTARQQPRQGTAKQARPITMQVRGAPPLPPRPPELLMASAATSQSQLSTAGGIAAPPPLVSSIKVKNSGLQRTSSSGTQEDNISTVGSISSNRTLTEGDDWEEDFEDEVNLEEDIDEFGIDEEDDFADDEAHDQASGKGRHLQRTSSSGTVEGDITPMHQNTVVFQGLAGNGECRVKLVCEEAEAGGLLAVLYADYWIVNHTGLELHYGAGELDTTSVVVPSPLNTAKKHRSIVLYEPPEGRLRISYESAASTQTVMVTTPGMQEHVLVPSRDRSRGCLSLNLGVAVDVGPGMLHRTNMITIVPRFTFANYTSCDLYVRLHSTHGISNEPIKISPGGSMPFWVSSAESIELNPGFQVRFGSQRVSPVSDKTGPRVQTTEWSGRINVHKLLRERTVISCRLKRGSFFEIYQLEVHVGDSAGSIVVDLSEHGLEELRNTDTNTTVRASETKRKSFFSRFSRIKFFLSVSAVQIHLQRDQTELSVFYRGQEQSRKERNERIAKRTGIRTQRHTARRPEAITTLSLQVFKIVYLTDQITDKFSIRCGSLVVVDQTSEPLFPEVLSGSGTGSSATLANADDGKGSFFHLRLFNKRTNIPGYTELDLVEVNIAPLDLKLAETFLLELLDLKTSVLHANKLESQKNTESGVESVRAVFMWEDLGQVSRAARRWARRRAEKAGVPWYGSAAELDDNFDAMVLSGRSSVSTGGNGSALGLNSIKINRVLISKVEIRLSYQQHHDKLQSAALYDLGGGLLSRMHLRVDDARMSLDAFEKSNFIGSSTTLFALIQNHYQDEVRKSIMGIFSAVSLRSDFGIAATIRDRLSLTSAKVQSDEFPMTTYPSSEALVQDYKRRLRPDKSCNSIESFVTLLRNFVYDWRNNHRFLYGRKVCVIGIVNRSSKGIRVDKPKANRLARGQILVPHTEIPPVNSASILEPWKSGREWNEKGYTAWVVSSKLKESVILTAECLAFKLKASVPGELAITSSQNFNVAFLYRDVQSTNALYVIAIEDRLPLSFRNH